MHSSMHSKVAFGMLACVVMPFAMIAGCSSDEEPSPRGNTAARQSTGKTSEGPSPRPGRAAAQSAADSERDAKALEAVRKLLKPWHEFKPEWVREASVIVQGTGYITIGACIFFGDGASGIPEVEAFRIQKVLKGRVRCSNIEFRSDTFTGLPYFVEGRNYLLFLTPDSGDSKGLADPKGFGFVGPDKAVVALIDLSETKSEVLARNVKAMRSGKFEGFEFTPKKWDAMRRAKKVDYRQQARLIKFLENVVLLQGKTPVDIGQYLGLRDYQYTPSEATYYLNIPASTSSKDGQIFSDLELKFHPGGSLASYTIEPMRTKRESSYGYSSNILSNEEMTKLGLRRVTNSFLPGN